jgi:hypothetical protein
MHVQLSPAERSHQAAPALGGWDVAIAEQQRTYQALSTQADQLYANSTFAAISRQRVSIEPNLIMRPDHPCWA